MNEQNTQNTPGSKPRLDRPRSKSRLVEISEQDEKILRLLADRYYFGLFQEIATEDEEFMIRDTIMSIVQRFDD